MVESSLINILDSEYNCQDDNDNMPTLLKNSPYYDNENAIDILKNKQNAISILSLNCQSLPAKFDQIKIYLRNFEIAHCPFTIMALQETWLSNNHDVSLFQLDGYNLLYRPCSSSTHGGVAIYLRGNIEYKVLSISSNSNIWDGLFVEIIINNENVNRKVIIANIYRPPRETIENYETFVNEIENIISINLNSYKEIVITGDFNIDLLKVGNSTSVNNFFETMISCGFIPKIVLPTRITENSATLIDNCFVKLSSNFSETTAGILNYNVSDHQPYFITLDYLVNAIKMPKHIKVFVNSASAQDKFKEEISQLCTIDKFQVDKNQDPNINYNYLDSILQTSLNKHLPVKTARFNKYCHKRENWITTGIMRSIKFRDKLYQTLKCTPINSPDYNKYKVNLQTYNKILKNNIRQAKKNYYFDCFTKFKSDIKKTWATIKQIINKCNNDNQYPKYFLINGQPESDHKTIANEFNSFFAGIGPKLASTITAPINKTYTDYLINAPTSEFKFCPVSENDVKLVIENLKSKSSSGVDRISNKLIKFIKFEIYKPLTIIINQILYTGIFPSKLKIAKIIPIFKTGDNYVFNNYRPISLLPSLSKIVERIMHNQLFKHFNDNKLFYDSQYGFRQQHSTELAAIELIDKIVTKMNNNELPLNIYLDLSKAFDTLDHDILLNKMKFYGIKGSALQLFKSYLFNREQYVEFGEVRSDYKITGTGVPQGSILGPLFFIIYVNDIVSATTLFDAVIYADDTALFATLSAFGKFNENCVNNINKELDEINDWFKVNRLSLNVKKTKAMLFHQPRKKVNNINIQIDNTNIEFVENFNYLGIVLDKNLSWKYHLNLVFKKISKTLGIMTKLKNFMPTAILKTIYNTLIFPHMNYGILAWGSQCNKLKKMQKRAVRLIVNARYNAHTDPIFKYQSLLKVEDLFALQELKFIYKLKNNNLPNYFLNKQYLRHSDVHTYNTRHANDLVLLTNRHNYVNNSICYRVPYIINNCPNCIKEKIFTHSIRGFTQYTKNYFINKYTFVCHDRNCFSCQVSSRVTN